MIDLIKYENLLDEQIIVTLTNGQVFTGEWIDWTSEQDNEPDPESITIEQADGILVELFVHEIDSIRKAP